MPRYLLTKLSKASFAPDLSFVEIELETKSGSLVCDLYQDPALK
jgi:hypothetical protein